MVRKGKLPKNQGIFIGGIFVLCMILALYLYNLYQRIYPNTENAYVAANLINVEAKVGGYLKQIYAKNNQYVKKGTLLLKIDPLDFNLQLEQAQHALVAVQQQAESAQRQITSAVANQSRAVSNYKFAQQMAIRYSNLYKQKAGSLQNMQKYVNQANQARQVVEQASIALEQATMQYQIIKTKIATAKISVRNAEVNKSYTQLYAPVDGYVSNLNLQQGQLISPGQKLFGLVDNSHWWINANMKETQLRRIEPGQKVTVKLDMYDHSYYGTVKSISYASGATFTLLPAENASGNWVKVTQYFTVRVALKNNPNFPLRVGASANVTIDTLKSSKKV